MIKMIEYNLNNRCKILLSPIYNRIDPQMIVEWILADSLPVRFQLQMHKYIWGPEVKGV